MGLTAFVELIERGFYRLGVCVARRPYAFISACTAVAAFAGLALLAFGIHAETSPIKLWVPPDSSFAADTEWIVRRFGAMVRPQRVIAVADDVITSDVVALLAPLANRLSGYDDVCFRVPQPPFTLASNSTDIAANFNPLLYCFVLSQLPLRCLTADPFDSIPANLSKAEIVESVARHIERAQSIGLPISFDAAFGGVRRDSHGRIESARSVLVTWFVKVNLSSYGVGNTAGTEEWSSREALAWENDFLDVMSSFALEAAPHGVRVYYEAGRSFGDVSGDVMFSEIGKLSIGAILMFVYIQLILSKFNLVEIKLGLGGVGLLCVGFALVTATALCSALGVPYGPVHNSMPFLLMGLGIDDMFVMKACWETLTDRERAQPPHVKIGYMLRHAGVSIVVTSFTDIVAFSVGAVTVLPSLQSFCIYAATGVFFVFVFSVTMYVAAFTLDERRVADRRDGIFPWVKRPHCKLSSPDQISISRSILHKIYSKCILTLPAKLIVIGIVACSSIYSVISLLQLEQRFDPIWFVPEDTYYSDFLKVRQEFYPEMGHEGSVFLGALNYSEELPKIFDLVDALRNETWILQDLTSWTDSFARYMSANFKRDIRSDGLSDSEFSTYLSKFLFSPVGGRYQINFRFAEALTCGKPAPPVTVSTIDFQFRVFEGPKVYLPAKHRLESLVAAVNFTTGDRFATVWAKMFANWVTDEVIDVEVERNLELALVCVMVCTLLLIADVQVCFWIFICVLLTLVNVCGWMQRWGLTIDIVTCIGLELGVGFCVDYAAHVGHTFLTVHGTKQERALATVTSIGAAVLYGGGSTLLALSMLSASKTYVFKAFFKIFFLVIFFGLFHGLLFLPVVLSLIGPSPYAYHNAKTSIELGQSGVDNTKNDVPETERLNGVQPPISSDNDNL